MRLRQIGTLFKHFLVWGLLTLFLTNVYWIWSVFSTEAGTIQTPIVYGMAFNALLFYINAFWAYPRYWHKRWRYWLVTFGVVLIVSIAEAMVDLFYADSLGIAWAYYDQFELPERLDAYYLQIIYLDLFIPVLPANLIYWLASFGYLLPKENLRRTRLENENLQAELRHLKAQMEPHTLFNGINGIYHLIDDEPEAAKRYLLGFSDVLRYHIYSGQQDQISLEKEVEFLNHYFQLSQLRVGEGAKVKWDFPTERLDQKLPPLLFYPFAENAFKYLSDFENAEKNQLTASLQLDNKRVCFFISNTFRTNHFVEEGGVGLVNIRERLELLYPARHSLEIEQGDGVFKVKLQLQIDE